MQTHMFYAPKEAAEYFGLSTICLTMWRTHGEGPPYFKDPGTGRVVYNFRDIKAFKAKREETARRKTKGTGVTRAQLAAWPAKQAGAV